MTLDIPRSEYPRPQFKRKGWQNLNGRWKFDFDEKIKGKREHWYISHDYPYEIVVPFVYQSKLSGIHDLRFTDHIWYEKEFELKYSPQSPNISNIILHFGAVDYFCYVYLNESLVGYHRGGSTPFSFNITQFVNPNKNKLTVYVIDAALDPRLTRGKQTTEKYLSGCRYEKVSGIWQTVWIEYLPEYYIIPNKTYFKANSESGEIILTTNVNKFHRTNILELEILKDGSKINPEAFYFDMNLRNDLYLNQLTIKTEIDVNQVKRWDIEKPNLYQANILIKDGNSEDESIIDKLHTYFAFRDLKIEGKQILLNNREFYMKSLLYQGYFPDGLWTAPSDEAIKKEIELTLEMGYNHLRLHQIFADPRFLYWADKLGLSVWGEAPNAFVYDPISKKNLINEWMDIVNRDRNHPSIFAWVPVNESWGLNDLKNSEAQRHFLRSLYYLTKNLDPTRPVIDNDGWEHVLTDIITIHIYREAEEITILPIITPDIGDNFSSTTDILHRATFVGNASYQGQPVIITEWGGWGYYKPDPDRKPSRTTAWGYGGKLYHKFDEVLEKYKKYLMELSKRKEWIKGHCYTEFCDQYQEVNGMLTFNREPKTDLEKLKKINDELP
ncbi:MAG: glycoside hydrolase family 2 [Candidatus Lokiarchaeota archaeon]|nr:glycoside hydrolase family 2 [Candidatus Lokiarchaeota archaeon]